MMDKVIDVAAPLLYGAFLLGLAWLAGRPE